MIDVSAILFDFFGTLVTYEPDRSRLEYPATHRLARSLGYRWDHDHFVTDWHAASSTLEARTAESHAEFSMTDAAHAFAKRSGLVRDERAAVELGATVRRRMATARDTRARRSRHAPTPGSVVSVGHRVEHP